MTVAVTVAVAAEVAVAVLTRVLTMALLVDTDEVVLEEELVEGAA